MTIRFEGLLHIPEGPRSHCEYRYERVSAITAPPPNM